MVSSNRDVYENCPSLNDENYDLKFFITGKPIYNHMVTRNITRMCVNRRVHILNGKTQQGFSVCTCNSSFCFHVVVRLI